MEAHEDCAARGNNGYMFRAETKKVSLRNKSKKFSMPENGPPKARRRAWKAYMQDVVFLGQGVEVQRNAYGNIDRRKAEKGFDRSPL